MNEQTLHRRNFLLHLRKQPLQDEPVLIKEPAQETPTQAQLDQLHNEYLLTRRLTGVAGIRPALAKEGNESRPALFLKYIQGRSLAELIRTASLDLGEKLRIALKSAEILCHVHDHHVIHKDLSSSNILVADDNPEGSGGGIYLIDFGISSISGEDVAPLLVDDDICMGTLPYVSPEQTGRTNCPIDYRTDLYSLGIVLYELFTGQLPFSGTDALKLIHDHLARRPRPPDNIHAGIPAPVSDIILKLLAKDPNDRYQTARGLQTDLERCFDQWQRQRRIEPFDLGAHDFTGQLQIPQRLYGRQNEIGRLQKTLERAFTEHAQLLLVGGYSGVGKTSLVREIKKDVIAKGGVFIEGKFDQVQRTQPYSGWAQAFTQLVSDWLLQNDTSITRWRDIVRDAVGDNGQILIDIVPALESILGPQPGLPELGGVEAQHRINYFFVRFIESLATDEHPLIVFLDDLQWIDSASLQFIEALFAVKHRCKLLVVGAFRSNEVGTTHPLAISLARMKPKTDRVTVFTLQGLPPAVANQLLADSLRLGVADCRDLGRVLFEKSGGNPLYYRQLLYALETDDLLTFDRDSERWAWRDYQIQKVRSRGNIVDLMVERLRALPADTRHIISRAACLGGHFDLATLQTVALRPQSAVRSALNSATQTKLILRSGDHFSFTHDRVQEAAYLLIPELDRPRVHLEIGRLLLARMAPERLDEEIFFIAGLLNAGRELIDKKPERTDLAALNLSAAKKAKAASAYVDAKRYIETGLELIGPDSWSEQYELTLSLHNENGELAFLTGQTDQVATISASIHANTRGIIDRIRIYMVQIEDATSRSQFADGLDLGLAALRDLGIDIPVRPTLEDSQRLREKFSALLAEQRMERLNELPKMANEKSIAKSALLASVMSTAYIANPPLFPIISFQGAILTLESGLDVWSPFFVGGVALVSIASITPDTPDNEARQLMQLSRRLVDMIQVLLDNPITLRSRTKGLMMLAFTSPWFQSYEDSIDFCRATYESRKETGDWLYGAYGASLFADQSLAAGLNLPDYRHQLTAYKDTMERLGQVMNPTSLAIHLQIAGNFIEPCPMPHHLRGAQFDEDEWFSQATAEQDLANRHWLAIGKLVLAYYFDRDEALDEYAAQAEEFLAAGPCLMSVARFYFFQALARLRQIRAGDATRHPDSMVLVGKNLHWLELWSEITPSTFWHRYELLAAEAAKATGDTDGALSHYERAINGARTSGFTHEEALANELYARFWVERGSHRFAGPLMREAHSLYLKWGAVAKAEHLSKRFPTLLVGDAVVSQGPGTPALSEVTPAELDLRTVLRASQDIASQLSLNSLLESLMANAIENTGAQRGFLLLKEDDRWVVAARASVNAPATDAQATQELPLSDQLEESIIHFVARTLQALALEDASQSEKFSNCRYVQAHQIRSVLCVPLVNQRKLSAILYLENNLAPRVFSVERVHLLELLSSQMAIAIENARAHADLERLLESRSKALASAETQIHTLFEDSPLGIALTSPDGRFLSVNKAVLEMLQTSEGALLEQRVVDFYANPSDRDALLRKVSESGMVQDFGVQLVRCDGSLFHASLNISRLVLEDEEIMLTMVQDVTSQIMAEQEAAVLDERTRLARELHDAVSQTILSASLLADATVRTWEQGHGISTGDLAKLSRMLRGALDEMRTLLFELRPASLRNRTLGQLLTALVETTRSRTNVVVELEIKHDRTLPERVMMTLLRIAQECLNNAIQHAFPTTVKVSVGSDPDELVLRVTDDGKGFDVTRREAGHHGLDILYERAEEIGADLEIESCAGCGTAVSVTWS
jgi:PAS domain S-box-containing protein